MALVNDDFIMADHFDVAILCWPRAKCLVGCYSRFYVRGSDVFTASEGAGSGNAKRGGTLYSGVSEHPSLAAPNSDKYGFGVRRPRVSFDADLVGRDSIENHQIVAAGLSLLRKLYNCASIGRGQTRTIWANHPSVRGAANKQDNATQEGVPHKSNENKIS